jgi:hypothetical protein
MRYALLTLALALPLLAAASRRAAWADDFGAGFRDLLLTDPVEGGPMPAIVFYPTRGDSGSTQVGPYSIAAPRQPAGPLRSSCIPTAPAATISATTTR